MQIALNVLIVTAMSMAQTLLCLPRTSAERIAGRESHVKVTLTATAMWTAVIWLCLPRTLAGQIARNRVYWVFRFVEFIGFIGFVELSF